MCRTPQISRKTNKKNAAIWWNHRSPQIFTLKNFPMLSVCWLGGEHGREFAHSISWLSSPSLRELCYAKIIETGVNIGGINDFGLSEALKNLDFKAEFLQFINETSNKILYNFPKILEFVKYRIWYIVIHQQQVEGLFNK